VIGLRRRRAQAAAGFAAYDDPFELDTTFTRSGGRRRLPRLGPLLLVGVVLLLGLLVGGYFWVRSSSLSAVRNVRIIGLSGAQAGEIRGALSTAARTMSTLNVDNGEFHNTVAAYPEVKSVKTVAAFPHNLTITVAEQNPVAVVSADGYRTVVSGDGTLLPNATTSSSLPTIAMTVAPGGTTLSGAPLQETELLAAAPYQLLPKIASATESSSHGLTVSLRSGPELYFGANDQLSAKWSSAVAVLAGASSAGAGYIDVTDPSRPAAGP
jgi:cell division protein FtsQ